MLLVILGAGASFDSVPAYPPRERSDLPERPPLADALFENRPIFKEAMRSFPTIQAIVPLLQRRDGQSLEQRLQALAAERMRAPQLMSVRYYIQYVLRRIESPWQEVAGQVTNLKTLLDEIDRYCPEGEAVCIVTFNYDRLVEDALRGRGIHIGTLQDYAAHTRFKLFKVHGSIDWVRRTGMPAADHAKRMNQWDAAAAMMDLAGSVALKGDLAISTDFPSGMLGEELVAPAIAIPLESKTDFEIPDDQLALLEHLLPETTRVLAIGWRAAEQHFLRVLANHAFRAKSVFLCCGTHDEGQASAERMKVSLPQAHFEVFDGGFTDLVEKRTYLRLFEAA